MYSINTKTYFRFLKRKCTHRNQTHRADEMGNVRLGQEYTCLRPELGSLNTSEVTWECRPSVARNLDFYVKDPKWWLSVQTESTVYTNTEQANWNMPQAKFCLQMLVPGLGSSWVGCVLSWGPSGMGLWVDPDGFSAVDLCQSLPFSRKDWVHLCVIPREMPVGSETNWPHQDAQEKTG